MTAFSLRWPDSCNEPLLIADRQNLLQMRDSASDRHADGTIGFPHTFRDIFGWQTLNETQSQDFALIVVEFCDRLLQLKLFLVAGEGLTG